MQSRTRIQVIPFLVVAVVTQNGFYSQVSLLCDSQSKSKPALTFTFTFILTLLLFLSDIRSIVLLLGLPDHIKMSDGSLDRFEYMFKKIDDDGSESLSWEEFEMHFLQVLQWHIMCFRMMISPPLTHPGISRG